MTDLCVECGACTPHPTESLCALCLEASGDTRFPLPPRDPEDERPDWAQHHHRSCRCDRCWSDVRDGYGP